MEKFIYVFSESDRDTLLRRDFTLAKEPKKKRGKAKPTEDEKATEELSVWVFYNKSVRDMILDSLDHYVLSNVLTF